MRCVEKRRRDATVYTREKGGYRAIIAGLLAGDVGQDYFVPRIDPRNRERSMPDL